jgi:predicted GNAT family acetyltransferase
MAYEENGEEAIGHIFMTLEKNNRIKFLDAWVDESHRRKGIYRKLWETRWEYVNENYKGWTIYAWCKDSSLPLLLEKGFNAGEVVTYVEKIIE